jgi:hypothetical protein
MKYAIVLTALLMSVGCQVEKTGEDTYQVEAPTDTAETAFETATAETATALETAGEATETALREGARETGTAIEEAGKEIQEHSKPGDQN